MPVIVQDSGAGTNGSAWGPTTDGLDTWVHLVGSAALSRSGGELRASNNANTNLCVLGDGSLADQDITAHLEQGDSGNFLGCVVRCQDANNFYYCDLGAFPGFMALGKRVGGTFTDVDFFTFTYDASTKYVLKLQAIGSTIHAKVWAEGSSEPASWGATMTDSTFASGKYGLYSNTGTTPALFDNITVTDTVSTTNLITQARAQFYVKANQATEARSNFKIRTAQVTQARSQFVIAGLKNLVTQARTQFKVRARQISQARSKFLIPIRSIVAPISFAFSQKQLLNLTFSQKQQLIITRTSNVAKPNSTVVSTANLTDAAGGAVTNPSTLAVTITFPDGTSESHSLTAGVVNAGSGNYTLTYETKGVGMIKEEWVVTLEDATTSDAVFLVPVSY